MKTEVIRTWSEFRLLAGEWNELLRSSRADTVFLTWEWISSWAEVVGDSVEPLVVVVRDGSRRLVGIASLYRAPFIAFRTIPLKALRFMADRATGAEYANWIVRRDVEAEAAQEIARALRELRREWDLLWMPNIRGWDGSLAVLLTASKSTGMHCHSRMCSFSCFQLPRSPAEFRASLSGNRREQLNRQERNLARHGEFVVRRCRTQKELPRFLETLFALNAKRWSLVGRSGTFVRKPEEMAFYRSFAPKALEQGWLAVFALEAAGEFQAVQIGYVYGNVYHQLQEGFAPDYVAGVGNVLRMQAIAQMIREGISSYDFLGGMSEHKRRWTAQPRTGTDLLIVSGRARARWLALFPIWPTGRFLQAPAVTRQAHA